MTDFYFDFLLIHLIEAPRIQMVSLRLIYKCTDIEFNEQSLTKFLAIDEESKAQKINYC